MTIDQSQLFALEEETARETLFAKQVAAGTSPKDARSYADRIVLRPLVKRRLVKSIKAIADHLGSVESVSLRDDHTQASTALVVDEPRRRGLSPVHHPNRDFFLCDLFDYSMKDDGVSMEVPIFTLATKPDISIWSWTSKDKTRSVKVTPSVLGRATQHDKDLLIYVVSQMTEALNRGRADASLRTIRFRVYDYLVATNKPVGGADYERLKQTLRRLRGTTIETDIRTGGVCVSEGFGLIERWKTVEKSSSEGGRMTAIEVTMSTWLFNAIQAREVLTISPDYFRLRKSLERRLYELARKHCGSQARFTIGIDLLQEKSGSKSTNKEFKRMLKDVAKVNQLPDYSLSVDDDRVLFELRKPPSEHS